MGYIAHHAIVVTSWNDKTIVSAHAKATELGALVSPIIPARCNGEASFFIAPDGSKEGWVDSDKGDEQRDSFIEWADSQAYEDGSSPIAWVEVRYSPDDHEATVSRHAWDKNRED